MVTVQLHNLIFSGRHGVFKEELATGNTFEVNLDVSYDESGRPFTGLDSIVNYVILFDIIKERQMEFSADSDREVLEDLFGNDARALDE